MQLCDAEENPDLSGFCLDIEIQAHQKKFLGQLFLPPNFQKLFADHFSNIQNPHPLSLHDSSLYRDISISLRLILGHTLLSQQEWEGIVVGDFLLLDRCTYNPKENKGILDFYWNDTPLFHVNIKKQNLKILDYADYHGDINNMNLDMPSHFSDDDEFTETLPSPAATPEKEHDEDQEEEHAIQKKPAPLLTTKDVPFSIVVELDRITLSLEKLLQLAPGNVLELPASPDQGVTLTVHGKSIARGELLKIGELFGVKILEIGKLIP